MSDVCLILGKVFVNVKTFKKICLAFVSITLHNWTTNNCCLLHFAHTDHQNFLPD